MKEMSEATIIAITSATTICTLILSRIRCILRPCDPEGQYFQSGCTDQKLDRGGHEIKVDEHNLNGRDVLVCHAND